MSEPGAPDLPPLPDVRPPAEPEVAPAETPDRARTFPCSACGADLAFDPGVQSLRCPYCGSVERLDSEPAVLPEQDYAAAIRRIAERRDHGRSEAQRTEAQSAEDGVREIECAACGATSRFEGSLETDTCAYCGAPLQATDAHAAANRLAVDGILPFRIDKRSATDRLRSWIRSRWFAPSELTRRGAEAKVQGVYLPYWTFDAQTHTSYTGQRGDHYWETVGSGKNRRRVQRTRWSRAAGRFRRVFDDLLVLATRGVPAKRLRALEPWPLQECRPYDPALLAGFQSRTYDVELEAGFTEARSTIDAALRAEACSRIGGDEQRISSLETAYEAITYKHLLLPVWMLAYRYGQKTYLVRVNAVTGEVQGDRPWSWIKIALAVLAVLAILGLITLVRALAG